MSITVREHLPARAWHDLSLPEQDDSLVARGLAVLHTNREAFDEALYQSARLQFLEIARPYLVGDYAYIDFVRIFFRKTIEKFGDGVKPYAIRFCKECEPQFTQRDRNNQQRRKPSNLANSSERAKQNERYRQARVIFDRETALGNWQVDDPAIASALAIFRQLADEHYEQAYYPLSVLVRAGRRGLEDAAQAQHLAQLAFEWSLAKQHQEDPILWCDLGDMYKNGHGVKPDLQQAEYWHRKAAEWGYARGQWALGLELYDGERTDSARNEEALAWMSRAAAQGEPLLQCWLGDFYRMGMRYEDALQWYGRAAAQDDKEGLFKLGTMYEEGNGVPQDNGAAAFWYRKAAKQGHAEAQWQLGQMRESDGY